MGDPHVTEWVSMLLRWFHLVTGAAWIGASFYFNWLNNHVRPPEGDPADHPGIKGEVWAIHGGAFYRASKFGGAPERLPTTLHWFKYEAYFTFLTGFSLLISTYWMSAGAMMVDAAVHPLSAAAAVGVGAGTLVVGWLVYDALCRSPIARNPRALAATGLLLLSGAAFALFHLLSARAAAMHLGAMIGTIMAANVFFVIIPGQRAMVDAMVAGQPPPLEKGAAGSLRSLHNNYLTLPALFIMVSNHYPAAWSGPYGWLVVLGILCMGVLIRHSFNLRGIGHSKPWGAAWVGAVGLVVLGVLTRTPAPPPAATKGVSFTRAQMIIANRCLPCHAREPMQPGFTQPPKELVLEDRATIELNRARIATQVRNQVMPLGNLTGMTDEERADLVAWAEQP